MKIERINENQIRCTLTPEDLSGRQIRLSELAYGSSKARQLFNEMMQEARQKVGFDSGTSPLMIEAIPLSPDNLMLIITKVDDPEELDTRFSRFTRSEGSPSPEETPTFPGADDVLELFNRIFDAKPAPEPDAGTDDAGSSQPSAEESAEGSTDSSAAVDLTQSFRFRKLDDLIQAAHCIAPYYDGDNTVFRSPDEENGYRLVIHQSGLSPEDFNRLCNMLSEYGSAEIFSPARAAWLSEHGTIVITGNALQLLADL